MGFLCKYFYIQRFRYIVYIIRKKGVIIYKVVVFSKKGSLGQIRYVRRQGIIEESKAVKCKKGLMVYLKITLSPEKATFKLWSGGVCLSSAKRA